MASDKDDQGKLNNDLDLNEPDDFMDEDYMDADSVDEPLSATSLGGAEDYDQDSSDDDFGSDDEFEDMPPQKEKKSGGITKMILPVFVLLAAAGAGGYIVMNPAVLNNLMQKTAEVVPAAETPVDTNATLAEAPLLPTPEVNAETSVDVTPELAANEIPPQPAANINEEPQASVNAEALVEAPVTDLPANTAPAVSDSEATAIENIPTEPLLDVKPAETGENVVPAAPVSVEAASAEQAVAAPAPDATAPATPEPVAEPSAAESSTVKTEPETIASSVPSPPVVEPTPAPTVETAANVPVTEPTFVPAPPTQSATPTEVAEADVAAPPVMNVQEVSNTNPENITPKTIAQAQPSPAPAPQAVNGNSAAPIAPLPTASASNTYYDSLSQVPSGSMATSIGPREVNPVIEPASKMVIVSKYKSGDSQEALLVSATRALKLKRYDAALEMFDQLYAKNRRDVRILMGRAVAQQNMGLSESAIQSYEEVLALKPNNTEALLNMMGLLRNQYPEVALRRLLDLYSAHPNNAGIAAQIGITNAGMGHYEDAMRYLGIASTLEPGNAQHLFNMAIAADRQGEAVKAIELYQRALEVDVMYGASRSIPRERIYDRLSVLRRG